MGDRDFQSIIQNAIRSIGKELEIDIDSKDIQTIQLLHLTNFQIQNIRI